MKLQRDILPRVTLLGLLLIPACHVAATGEAGETSEESAEEQRAVSQTQGELGGAPAADAPPASAPSAPSAPNTAPPAPTPSAGCEDGAIRDCKVILPTQNGVENCFVGEQVCVAGAFSRCVEPERLAGTHTFSFHAECPPGTHVDWVSIDYNLVAPRNESGPSTLSVKISGKDADILNAAMDAPSCRGRGCAPSFPKHLGGNARKSDVSLDVSISRTPDQKLTAVVRELVPIYECIDNQGGKGNGGAGR